MPRRPANRRWDGPSHCGGSRAAAAVADNVLVSFEPEATVVARLRRSLERFPGAKRFVVHGDWHPPFDEIAKASEGFGVSVYTLPVTDTCKEVAEGVVQRTVPRDMLVIAAGPWIFSRDTLERGFERVGQRPCPDLLRFAQLGQLQVHALPRP